MAKILLIDTATEACSAAISVDGRLIVSETVEQADNHAALLTLQIQHCSRQSGIELSSLDAVALSAGPGAYTALRVGASVAKGICYALDKPLLAIDTLQALAHASLQQSLLQESEPVLLCPMIDARRQEVWTAVYAPDLSTVRAAQPLVLENNSFETLISECIENQQIKKVIISGNGSFKIRADEIKKIAVTHSKIIKCFAVHLLQLAELSYQQQYFADAAYFEPFYMKAPNITIPKPKLL